MDLGTNVVIRRRLAAGRQKGGCRQEAALFLWAALQCGQSRVFIAHPCFWQGLLLSLGCWAAPGTLAPGAGTLQREDGAGKRGGLAVSALALPPVPESCFHLLF